MQEIAAQLINGSFYPLTLVDEEATKEYKNNQIVKLKITGVRKPRSYLQLKMYFGLCEKVSENTRDQHWSTKEKVDYQIRVELQFVDPQKMIVDRFGNVHLHYRSISFKNLKHIEACRYFDRAWEVMAKKLEITVEELLANADKG